MSLLGPFQTSLFGLSALKHLAYVAQPWTAIPIPYLIRGRDLVWALWIDRWMGGQMGRCIDRCMDSCIYACNTYVEMHVCRYEWMDRWVGVWMGVCMYGGWVGEWMDGWICTWVQASCRSTHYLPVFSPDRVPVGDEGGEQGDWHLLNAYSHRKSMCWFRLYYILLLSPVYNES